MKATSRAVLAMCGAVLASGAAYGTDAPPTALSLAMQVQAVTVHGPRTETVCAGTARPGWVKVDEVQDPESKCPTAEGGNVWLIAKLDEVPPRQALAICKVKVVPLHWYMWKSVRDHLTCGQPGPDGADNVMIIRRGREPAAP